MTTATPFEIVSRRAPLHYATKAELLRRVRDIEDSSLREPPPAFAFACLQDIRFLTPRTLATYARLAASGTRVTVFARGAHALLAPGVNGVDLLDDDPLGDQWTVLLAGRSFTCLAAADLLLDPPRDGDRSFMWSHTEDPDVVSDAFDALARAGSLVTA